MKTLRHLSFFNHAAWTLLSGMWLILLGMVALNLFLSASGGLLDTLRPWLRAATGQASRLWINWQPWLKRHQWALLWSIAGLVVAGLAGLVWAIPTSRSLVKVAFGRLRTPPRPPWVAVEALPVEQAEPAHDGRF